MSDDDFDPDTTIAKQWRERVVADLKEQGYRIEMTTCGVVSESGPNGEPLGCGYPFNHEGPHAWASLPTWTRDGEGTIEDFVNACQTDTRTPEAREALAAVVAAVKSRHSMQNGPDRLGPSPDPSVEAIDGRVEHLTTIMRSQGYGPITVWQEALLSTLVGCLDREGYRVVRLTCVATDWERCSRGSLHQIAEEL